MAGIPTDHHTNHRKTRSCGNTAKPLVWLAFILAAAIATGGAADANKADQARALAERALDHIHDVGREQAFADFTRPDGGFVDGELYIFCQDVSGVVVAHGGNPKIVGRNMAGGLVPDGRVVKGEEKHLSATERHR